MKKGILFFIFFGIYFLKINVLQAQVSDTTWFSDWYYLEKCTEKIEDERVETERKSIKQECVFAKKRHRIIYGALSTVINKEKFSDHCYKDGTGYSAGYGDHYWCSEQVKEYRKKFFYRNKSDDYIRKILKFSKQPAIWRAKKHITEDFERLSKKKHIIKQKLGEYDISHEINVFQVASEDQLRSLMDVVYHVGGGKNLTESKFWSYYLPGFFTGLVDCVKLRYEWLKFINAKIQNLNSKEKQAILNRNKDNISLFFRDSCVF